MLQYGLLPRRFHRSYKAVCLDEKEGLHMQDDRTKLRGFMQEATVYSKCKDQGVHCRCYTVGFCGLRAGPDAYVDDMIYGSISARMRAGA